MIFGRIPVKCFVASRFIHGKTAAMSPLPIERALKPDILRSLPTIIQYILPSARSGSHITHSQGVFMYKIIHYLLFRLINPSIQGYAETSPFVRTLLPLVPAISSIHIDMILAMALNL